MTKGEHSNIFVGTGDYAWTQKWSRSSSCYGASFVVTLSMYTREVNGTNKTADNTVLHYIQKSSLSLSVAMDID